MSLQLKTASSEPASMRARVLQRRISDDGNIATIVSCMLQFCIYKGCKLSLLPSH